MTVSLSGIYKLLLCSFCLLPHSLNSLPPHGHIIFQPWRKSRTQSDKLSHQVREAFLPFFLASGIDSHHPGVQSRHFQHKSNIAALSKMFSDFWVKFPLSTKDERP